MIPAETDWGRTRTAEAGCWRLDILRPTGTEESSVRGEMGPQLTFRWPKVNETCDSSSVVWIAPGWRDLQGEVGAASRAGPLQSIMSNLQKPAEAGCPEIGGIRQPAVERLA